MFIVFVSFMILFEIEVLANYTEVKLTSDGPLHVKPFLFENSSIHFNITLDNNCGNCSTKEIYAEIYNIDGECIYSSYDNITDYNSIIIPSLNNSDLFENILPGSIYMINIEFEDSPAIKNYTVPECVGNYCVCVTQWTNLIKLIDVEFIGDHDYRVHYSSQNTSLKKGNYHITNAFYIRQDNNDRFDVPKLKYIKSAFEIPMEYLRHGDVYKLVIEYTDDNNINPICKYKSDLKFVAQLPSKHDNFLNFKRISIFVLFCLALILLCIVVKWSLFSSKALESIKKVLFSDYRRSPIIQNLKKSSFSLPNQEINTLYTPLEVLEDPYEFPRQNIEIKKVLGVGAFGEVYYAKAYNLNGISGFTMVAVKLLREGAPKEEQTDFLAEIKMFKNIGVHKNVVKFLGCVTKSQPYMTIMELVANGALKEYLLKLREIWIKNKDRRLFFPDDMDEKLLKMSDPKESDYIMRFDADVQTPLLSDIGSRPEPVLDHRELENFALQIATGMAYLEKIPVVHRDLAARNILITKEKILKISDFGMSRCGPYVNRHFKKVPLRWMAIEAIEQFKTDSKSDVWSFGVLLWEIGTLGAFPYENIPNDLILQALKSGARLSRPEICTDDLYTLMRRCWIENPKDRPTFADIVEDFNAKKHVYVDFNRVNPNYVFPPTDPK
ncbi:fibroblast growth factor receptor 3 [Anoplophora glabripennis]|nr:fibroblast growth factor receptor 3 [Anoplophora glabripennis]XP_018571412.1 fibroblast growth factor receptor 3 [Anoplophora glabripennis]